MFTKFPTTCNAASRLCPKLESLLLTLVHAELLMHTAFQRGQYSPAALSVTFCRLRAFCRFHNVFRRQSHAAEEQDQCWPAASQSCLPPRVYKQGTVQNCRMQIKSALQIQHIVLHGLRKRTASVLQNAVCNTHAEPILQEFCRPCCMRFGQY